MRRVTKRLKGYLLRVAFFLAFPAVTANAASVNITALDANGLPLTGAVVFLESEELSGKTLPLGNVQVAQQGKTFIPQLQVVTLGTAVEFPNRDTVRHHVYSFSEPKPFELKLYIGKPKAPVVFDKPGIVELGCNIHDHMIAWVLVVDTPLYQQSDEQGRVAFTELPSGNYQVRVWHKDLPFGMPIFDYQLMLADEHIEVELILEEINERL